MPLKNKFIKKTRFYFYQTDIAIQEIKRLHRLENGVRNYSGGIYDLHDRIKMILQNDHPVPEKTLPLLKDIFAYLRDLKIVGELERENTHLK